jgi:hypothetical protein
VARMGDRRWANSVLVGRAEERVHLEDVGVDRRIILRRIFKRSGRVWDGLERSC